MIDTLRETICKAFAAKVDGIASPFAAGYVPVYDDVAAPRARAEKAAIVIDWESEPVTAFGYDHDICNLNLRLVVLVQDIDARAIADDIMRQAHALIMADRLLGGLTQGISMQGADKTQNFLESGACAISHLYEVNYRRKSTDLATGYP